MPKAKLVLGAELHFTDEDGGAVVLRSGEEAEVPQAVIDRNADRLEVVESEEGEAPKGKKK